VAAVVYRKSLLLCADDFGCVPDGRVLERVSTSAGSVVLAHPDGTLRATDIGKNVAIPGAADLVATIAALVARKDLENVSMAAGATTLSAVFTDPDEQRFRADLHVGLRIAVTGAGPGGATLVTDVQAVLNPTTIELAAAASTAVAAVGAVMNRPDRVGLSNHARKSVAAVEVDLGDRVIDDGAMTVGGRGLTSATARFSLLDLGKSVTIPDGAGFLVTTIESFDSPTQVRLAAPAPRTVANVAADVWRTDSRPGLELLLASLRSHNVEPAEIRFGPGVYDFTRIPDIKATMNAAIGLLDERNLTLRGSGAGVTVLRLMPDQDLSGPDTHVIETRDCSNLTLRDLSVHGAYLTIGNANEQMHGININEGSEEIVIDRVRVFQTAGDGIRLLGSPTNKVRKVWLDDCRIVQNKRSGVGFQRSCEFVWIRGCYIEMTAPSTDSCVDFEPTGSVAPTDIIIDSNVIVHGTRAVAVSISGISGPDPTRRVQFVNNVLLGGEVFCTDVDQLAIRNNMLLVGADEDRGRVLVNVQRGGDSVLITGNLLVNESAGPEALINLSEVNQRQVTRAMVANNLCFARSGVGVRVVSSDDVAIEGNMIVSLGSCVSGVLVHAQTSDVDHVAVRDNDITVEGAGAWTTGIFFIGAPRRMHHVSALGNSIRGASRGVAFQGNGFTETPICALNRTARDVANPLVGVADLPEDAVVVGGAASRGGAGPGTGAGRFLLGVGDPDGRVVGNVGDVYQRLDENAAAALYVKQADDNLTTGWVAK
jgi:hypothetical protein